MNTCEILMKVDELLFDESRWTQGFSARKEDGLWCGVLDKDACKFCLVGAITRVLGTHGQAYDYLSARSALKATVGGSISEFNDYKLRTFAEIKYVIAETIRNERETCSDHTSI